MHCTYDLTYGIDSLTFDKTCMRGSKGGDFNKISDLCKKSENICFKIELDVNYKS